MTALGAHHPSALLHLADVEHAFSTMPIVQMPPRAFETSRIHPLTLGVAFRLLHEAPRHRGHQCRGGRRMVARLTEEVRHPGRTVQQRHGDVEREPVVALELQRLGGRWSGRDRPARWLSLRAVAGADASGLCWPTARIHGKRRGQEARRRSERRAAPERSYPLARRLCAEGMECSQPDSFAAMRCEAGGSCADARDPGRHARCLREAGRGGWRDWQRAASLRTGGIFSAQGLREPVARSAGSSRMCARDYRNKSESGRPMCVGAPKMMYAAPAAVPPSSPPLPTMTSS